MLTVLSIIFGIFAFFAVPFAVVFGLIGLWIFGFWGAFFGVVAGLGFSLR